MGVKQKSKEPVYKKVQKITGEGYEFLGGYKNKAFYLNGLLHRVDGPAIEWADGSQFWYLHGILLTKEAHKKMMNKQWYLNGKEVTVEEAGNLINNFINNKLKEKEPMPPEVIIKIGPSKNVEPYTSEVTSITINPKDPTDTSRSITKVVLEPTDEGNQLWVIQEIGEILIDPEAWPLIRDAVEKFLGKM